MASSSIKVGRLLTAGLVAGLIMNACDFVINNFLLADAWQRLAQSRNVDLATMGGPGALAMFIAIDLALGLLIVWIYAGIRPRFGPGRTTGIMAALTVFAAEALVMAEFAGWLFPWDLYIRSNTLLLISTLAGGIGGAWAYSEEGDVPD
jgi:hypothetical protein